MTSLLMKPTSAGKDTLHEQDQPLKKLAYVSNHRGPLLLGRLSFAKELLRSTKLSIDEVASRSGYVDTQFFRQIFKRENDCSPLEYRKRNQIKA